jgi:LmbE family N-acetylglucosaminyl deacetylase
VNWIYLSPHSDDVAYSCGGWVWEQACAGESIEVWTVCAGDPPDPQSGNATLTPFAEELHQRWQSGGQAADAGELRRKEDQLACERMGVGYRHFPIQDCIYRRRSETGRPLIQSVEDLFDPRNEPEGALVDQLVAMFAELLPPKAILVSPLTLGGHIDHRLTRLAAERLRAVDQGLAFYADYPYALQKGLEEMQTDLTPLPGEITPQGLEVWQTAIAAYASQISSFWSSTEEMRAQLTQYWSEGGGRLWTRAR